VACLSSQINRRLRSGRLLLQASTGKKKVHETPFQWKKDGHVAVSLHLSEGRRYETVQDSLDKKQYPISKITRAKGLEVWLKWQGTCLETGKL
jgi:hypothetical protein